jgi:hypothetical protein
MINGFNDVFSMFENGGSFNDVVLSMGDNGDVYPWLMVCKAQFSQRVGNVEDVNEIISHSLGNAGYSKILYERYVTYIQIISGFLIFPLFLFLLTRDYRHSMYEIVYAQPLRSSKYILLRYWGVLIPLMIYLYVFGLILNMMSAARFMAMGYAYQYMVFFPYFVVYLFPTIFFLSAVLMLLMLTTKRIAAVFPVYIAFVLVNVTPGVFGLSNDVFRLLSPILRLDMGAVSIETVIINRIVYFSVGIVFIVVACVIYGRLRRNLRKGITI